MCIGLLRTRDDQRARAGSVDPGLIICSILVGKLGFIACHLFVSVSVKKGFVEEEDRNCSCSDHVVVVYMVLFKVPQL